MPDLGIDATDLVGAGDRLEAPSSADVRPASEPAPRVVTVLLGLMVTFVGAIACETVLELSGPLDNTAFPGLLFIGLFHPANLVVIWLALVCLVALTGRLWLSCGLLLVLSGVVSAANHVKLDILLEPVIASDVDFLSSPGFLLSMVPARWVVLGALATLACLAIFHRLGQRAARRFPPVSRKRWPRRWLAELAVRVVIVAISVPLLVDTTRFNEPGNRWRALYESQGAEWAPWSQVMNVEANGFLGHFLYSMPVRAMSVPEGYGRDAMAELAQRYASAAATSNAGRTPGAIDDVNVVLVLSESFIDPTGLRGIDLAEDPLARLRRTMGTTWSGEALASHYGTGTSTMEFQALTGQSVGLFEPQLVSPYQMLVPEYDDYPSAVGWFEARGHKTMAIHPYGTEMYRRPEVYRTLGFDEFVHDTTMQSQHRIQDNPYISDAAAFEEVLHQIDHNRQPLLVNLVTMQNHVPTSGWYDDPVRVDGEVSEEERERIAGLSRGLFHTDRALHDFLAALSARGEKTVVVFYGDHLPGIFDDDVLRQNTGLDRLRTPLMIWSTENLAPRALGLTSPVQFLPLVLDAVGQPRPPYYELLSQAREELGAIAPGRIVGPDGAEVTESTLSSRARRLLDDLRMVQYDFSIGGRYAVDELWY